MQIPFTKAHGARNDFLLTRKSDVPAGDLPAMAQAICDRHTGVGADGWILISPADAADHDAAIRLFNSDGSEAGISGNGTRCAAAFLIEQGHAGEEVRIRTGAGIKRLRLLERTGRRYSVRDEHGAAGVHRRAIPAAAGRTARATSRCFGWAIRNAPCRWRTSISTGGRWARRLSVIRSFPTAPTSRFCARATSIPWRCASGSAARAKP